MAFLHEEEDSNNHKDEKKEHGIEDRYLLEPQNAHPTGEFIIVVKFGGHALHHLASRLTNVIRRGGREAENLVLAIFSKILYSSFYNCCIVLGTIFGFSNVKTV